MSKRWLLILAVVAVNLLVPLSYYVVPGDRYDERFAWRMFSSTRMARCDVRFTAGGRNVTLPSVFHTAWIKTAKRGRGNVVAAMGQHLCSLEGHGPPVTLSMSCKGVDGTVDEIADGTVNLCAESGDE